MLNRKKYGNPFKKMEYPKCAGGRKRTGLVGRQKSIKPLPLISLGDVGEDTPPDTAGILAGMLWTTNFECKVCP